MLAATQARVSPRYLFAKNFDKVQIITETMMLFWISIFQDIKKVHHTIHATMQDTAPYVVIYVSNAF